MEKYEISDDRKELLQLLIKMSQLYNNVPFLRTIVPLLGSMDDMYVSDKDLVAILKDEYQLMDFIEGTYEEKYDVMTTVYEKSSDFNTWRNRSAIHVMEIPEYDKRFSLTPETEAIAWERASERIETARLIDIKTEMTLADFINAVEYTRKEDSDYYRDWKCISYISYVEDLGLGWLRWPIVYTIYRDEEKEGWQLHTGTYAKIPFYTETIDHCISMAKPFALTLIFDYEGVCAENYCNLVNYGVLVNRDKKTVTFLDKYRAVIMFHELYTKNIKTE